MKLKYSTLVNAKEVLEKLMSKKYLDGVFGLKLSRNIKKIHDELLTLEQSEKRLIEKYGEKTAENSIIVSKEKRDMFIKEWVAILEQEVDVDILLLNPSAISDFSPSELISIEWMFDLS